MSKPAPSVFIAYGFCEGPKHGQRLLRSLRAAGFSAAATIESADIVIAHSGGCFNLPKGLRASMVLLCQPAIGYEQSPRRVLGRKVRLDVAAHRARGQLGAWTWKTALNLRYGVIRPGHNRRILRAAPEYRSNLAPVDAPNVAVVVSRDDPWSAQLPMSELHAHPQRCYLSMTGAHDDLWTDPEPVTAMVKALYAA